MLQPSQGLRIKSRNRSVKLAGARTVWIDSIANSEKLSLSGRLVRKHVDLCLTQWPHLTDAYPDVQCFGSVI
jgi:hypothetical protein